MLCDSLKGWDGVGGGREVQEVGDIYISMVFHFDVWQKPKQYYKAIILQTNKQINVKNAKKIYMSSSKPSSDVSFGGALFDSPGRVHHPFFGPISVPTQTRVTETMYRLLS